MKTKSTSVLFSEQLDNIQLSAHHLIDSLPRRPRPLKAALAKEPSASITGKSIVSFTKDISEKNKKTVEDCVLFSQLAANNIYDQKIEPINWYKRYTKILGILGWVIQDSEFTTFSRKGKGLSMDETVVKILEAALTGNELAIAMAAVDALKSLPKDDHRLRIFSHEEPNNQNRSAFQIVSANDHGGVPVMKTGTFHFNYSEKITQVLFFKYDSSKMHIKKCMQTGSLNMDVYNEDLNSRVREKLGDNAHKLVADIELEHI